MDLADPSADLGRQPRRRAEHALAREPPAAMREHLPPELGPDTRPRPSSPSGSASRTRPDERDHRRGGGCRLSPTSTRCARSRPTPSAASQRCAATESRASASTRAPGSTRGTSRTRATGEACCRIYNEWIADRLASRSPRFRCAGMIPTWSVDAAVAELRGSPTSGSPRRCCRSSARPSTTTANGSRSGARSRRPVCRS